MKSSAIIIFLLLCGALGVAASAAIFNPLKLLGENANDAPKSTEKPEQIEPATAKQQFNRIEDIQTSQPKNEDTASVKASFNTSDTFIVCSTGYDGANIRQHPTTNAAIIGFLDCNEGFKIVEYVNSDWVLVNYARGSGYLHRSTF